MRATDFRRQMAMLQVSDSAFPSGSFAFSNGLETLVGEKRIAGADDLKALLTHHVLPRWLAFDRWFLCHAHRAGKDMEALLKLDQLYGASTVTAKLDQASRRLGKAMLAMHQRIATPGAEAYRTLMIEKNAAGHACVVQGSLLAGLGLTLEEASASALYATLSASLSAALRLGVIGALEGQKLLQEVLLQKGADGLAAPLQDEPYASRPLIDIAVMRHATNETRLFAA